MAASLFKHLDGLLVLAGTGMGHAGEIIEIGPEPFGKKRQMACIIPVQFGFFVQEYVKTGKAFFNMICPLGHEHENPAFGVSDKGLLVGINGQMGFGPGKFIEAEVGQAQAVLGIIRPKAVKHVPDTQKGPAHGIIWMIIHQGLHLGFHTGTAFFTG